MGHEDVLERHPNQLTAEEAPPDTHGDTTHVEALANLPMEETMTIPTAGTRRGKRPKSRKASQQKKVTKMAKSKKEKTSRDSQVVFAFRLSRAERDRIHAAAGSGKATQFVKAAALAAANGDNKAFEQLVGQAKANLK